MKKAWFTGAFFIVFIAQLSAQKMMLVENNSAFERNEIISVPYAKFSKHFGLDTVFSVVDENGKNIPHQLEKLGMSKPVNVLLQVSLQAHAKLKLLLIDKPSERINSKTYARYVPERFDDFAWENDVLAFRMYGKALEGRADDAQGMDVWAKRTDQLIVDKWYKTGDYHQDHGEGLDYYSVGQTLGAADVGFYINDQLTYGKHYRRYKILDNGPLRTTFRLEFDPEEVSGQQIVLSKQISLDAGCNFNKITLNFENYAKASTSIAIGIVKRKEEKPLIKAGAEPFSLTYWEPEMGSNGVLGIAVVMPDSKVKWINDRPEQTLLITEVRNKKNFTYFNGAAWNKAGKINNEEEWIMAVERYKKQLKEPLKVILK